VRRPACPGAAARVFQDITGVPQWNIIAAPFQNRAGSCSRASDKSVLCNYTNLQILLKFIFPCYLAAALLACALRIHRKAFYRLWW
jgi:hypothetical protein